MAYLHGLASALYPAYKNSRFLTDLKQLNVKTELGCAVCEIVSENPLLAGPENKAELNNKMQTRKRERVPVRPMRREKNQVD